MKPKNFQQFKGTKMQPTSTNDLQKMLAKLDANKQSLKKLKVADRIELLKRTMRTTKEFAKDFVMAALKAKRIAADSPTAAEEWLGGPVVILRNLRLLKESLEQIQKSGHPELAQSAFEKKEGQVRVKVFPQNFIDKILYNQMSAEVWFDETKSVTDVQNETAWIYRNSQNNPDEALENTEVKIALVLGAGNVSSIGPMDVLYKLFVENQVCLLKMNPVNEYLGPHIAQIFRPLIDAGFLEIAYGAADVGEFLVRHDLVEEIHITGSDKVHDIIVWGASEKEQAKNKKAGTPVINKKITSELGCVTPIVIAPGKWSAKEIDFQVQNIATMIVNNASFNCNAAKLLVTSKNWAQREEFLAKLKAFLKNRPNRFAYYPGSDRKFDSFITAHPEAEILTEKNKDEIPWTAIFNVDSHSDDMVFSNEAWCGIITETALDSQDTSQFLLKASQFCNEKVWGTLSMGLIIDPKTQKANQAALDQAIKQLRYGSVAINCWPALSYGLTITTWGAYPGHTLDNIVSGIGVVHNTYMFKDPQKSVVWAPFTTFPKPPWFCSHEKGAVVAQKLVDFEFAPSIFKVPGIAINAMLG